MKYKDYPNRDTYIVENWYAPETIEDVHRIRERIPSEIKELTWYYFYPLKLDQIDWDHLISRIDANFEV